MLTKTGAVLLTILLLAGCTRGHYQRSADRETYRIIAKKSEHVPGMNPEFSVEEEEMPALEGLPENQERAEFLGDYADEEVGARLVPLEEALSVAFSTSRTYQNQKEVLFLQALSLTLDRHRFEPIFSGGGGAAYNRSTTDVTKLPGSARLAQAVPGWIAGAGGLAQNTLSPAGTLGQFLNAQSPGTLSGPSLTILNDLAGTPATLLTNYANVVDRAFTVAGVNQPVNEIMNERSVSGDTFLAANLLLKGGGEIAASITSDFLRFLTGDPRVSTSSALAASITQPLLRGAGRSVNAEFLTQAERDVLYQLREFTRFRKEFAVQVASSYYRVLQNRDTARNNWRGYQAFLQRLERDRAFAEVGQITQASLGRSEQAALSAENGWINSVRTYRQALDEFKILLGISTDAAIVLDDTELTRLLEKGIRENIVSTEDAVQVAMAARLDLYTARDQVYDAERKIKVAANALKPGLDLILTGDVDSEPGDDTWTDLDWRRARWSAGLDLDLPLDRKAERNAYRASLIDFNRAGRELDLAVDNVKLDVRDAWRRLSQSERTYRIRVTEVDLNKRRVEEQELLAQLGRVTVLDQIDAQNDLIDSQNGLTAALVDHTLSNLGLWLQMGILFIKEDGQWEDISDVDYLVQEQPADE